MADLTPVEGNPFAPTTPTLTPVDGNPFAAPPAEQAPLPQAFQDRMTSGLGVSQALQEHQGRGVMDKLLGLTGPRYQLWPETMARSAFTLPHDVMSGDVLTDPGLRKEDFSDDPDAADPLNTLIARTQDLAGFALPATAFDRPPVVLLKTGDAARLVSDADGTMHTQAIGPPPTPKDFQEAATVIGGPKALENLETEWQEKGLLPGEIAQEAQNDVWVKHSIGAAANTDPPLVSLAKQPSPPPGQLTTLAQRGIDAVTEISHDIKMLVSPMTAGTKDTMAIVKDTANTLRRTNWEWARVDQDLVDRFTPEQRQRMWEASDEDSVLQQEGKTNEHMGLATLTPEERAAVENLHTPSRINLAKMQDLGMVEGEGLPIWTPRVMANMVDAITSNKPVPLMAKRGIRTSSTSALERKYLTAEETEAAGKAVMGDTAHLVRDIRTLPFKNAEIERAIAGRTLINNIEEHGARTGQPSVIKGNLPAGADPKDWFTMPENLAFYRWQPMFERGSDGRPILDGNLLKVAVNGNGDTLFEKVPIHVHRDFEGPLKSIMAEKSGATYKALMAVKGKTMSLIMNSPLIHNVVEWSRSLPAMPMKVATGKIYFEGNRVKNDPAAMHEFIDNGLVPIGKRFFNQDISSIIETPEMSPGRSWTAQVLAYVPGLFDEAAGTAVKRTIDKAGDFWHNTLLWDRVADLQMGLATNFQRDAIAAGFDRVTATRYAAHFANRFAGSLPQEAMSAGARKLANGLLFSRSYTLGNLGVIKDMAGGLPGDVSAQIARDAGPEALAAIKSKARRTAISTVALDITLSIVGGSLLQNAFNVMLNDSSMPQEFRGYVRRLQGMKEDAEQHPLKLIMPWNLIAEAKKLSATADNEPGKQDRILIGHMKDGTGIYGTNPAGRMGNEFMDWMAGPLDQLKRKLGTFAKPALEIFSNDRGFGRKVYDPNTIENGTELQTAMDIAKAIAEAQAPTGQMSAFGKLVTSPDDKGVNALQLMGPVLGTNVSKGAPGGPGVGDYYHAKDMQQFQIQRQTAEIRDLIKTGDLDRARERMTALGMDKGYQRWLIKTTQNPALRFNPKTAHQLYQFLSPAQREHMLNQGRSLGN